jgi:hypothetical protein
LGSSPSTEGTIRIETVVFSAFKSVGLITGYTQLYQIAPLDADLILDHAATVGMEASVIPVAVHMNCERVVLNKEMRLLREELSAESFALFTTFKGQNCTMVATNFL